MVVLINDIASFSFGLKLVQIVEKVLEEALAIEVYKVSGGFGNLIRLDGLSLLLTITWCVPSIKILRRSLCPQFLSYFRTRIH